MDDTASIMQRLSPKDRFEWAGISYFLDQVEPLRARGLISDDSAKAMLDEYQGRRDVMANRYRYDDAMARVRALAPRQPRDAWPWSERARSLDPSRPDAWISSIELLKGARKFDEADAMTREAVERFPEIAAQLERRPAPVRFDSVVKPTLPTLDFPTPPTVSFSSIAGEFLKEHWQKLILTLAVLLIVVSATVGANAVLGPRLWSPAGKGILALVFTMLCGLFGLGLIRWGAERAGRMMLVATLLLVPINLMLAGEVRLIASGSSTNLGLLAVDLVVLGLLSRWLVGAMKFRSGWAFTAAYFVLAASNVGAWPGMAFDVGFAVFVVPAVVFLGAVAWLNREPWEGVEVAYQELGLLGFAFLAGVFRTGSMILHLPAPLYAVPTMLAAIAAVGTARSVKAVETDADRVWILRQGGMVLSALAFAIALARKPEPSALFSGNTLATALLGLGLYSVTLRSTRKPAYLYAAFASVFLAYFGAFYFARDLVHVAEEAARRAMGYDEKLPAPFKAINGLVFNVALVLLSRFFARRWSDERLARHCHYIGLPLSVAACLFSCFEPKAAVICLGGYAVLYALATRIYREPRLIYLACAATAGSCFFATALGGGMMPGPRSVIAASLGLVFWAIRALPALRRAGESYRWPLIHSARVLAAMAMAGAAFSASGDGVIPPMATLAFGLTALLAILNGFETPRVSVSLLAIAATLGAWIGAFQAIVGPTWASTVDYGLMIALFALAELAVSELVRRRSSEVAKVTLEAIGWAVPIVVAVAWGLATWGALWNGSIGWPVAGTAMVGGVAAVWMTRLRREVVLVYIGGVALAASAFLACGVMAPWVDPWAGLRWMGITSSACGMVAWAVGGVARRRSSAFYSQPCFQMAAGLTVLASAIGWRSPTSLVMVAVNCLLLVEGFGSAVWMFGTFAAIGLAIYQGWLTSASRDRLLLVVVGYAYLLAVLGMVIRRFGPSLHARLGLAPWEASHAGWPGSAVLRNPGGDVAGQLGADSGVAAYGRPRPPDEDDPERQNREGRPSGLRLDVPPAWSAIALGFLAVILQLATIAETPELWTSSSWLPWTLAGLCLLAVRTDPRRAWLDVATGLTGLGFVATVAPFVLHRTWWWPVGMALAVGWLVADRVGSRSGGRFQRALGLPDEPRSTVLSDWSLAAFTFVGAATACLVVASTWFEPSPDWLNEAGRWPDVMLAIGLAGLFVSLEGRRFGPEGMLVGFEVVSIAAAWWLGAETSPVLVAMHIHGPSFLALVTSAMAVAVVGVGLGASRTGVADVEFASGRAELVTTFTRWAGFALGLMAIILGAMVGGGVLVGALTGATVAFGLLGLRSGRLESAAAGSASWCGWVLAGSAYLAKLAGVERAFWAIGLPAVALTAAMFVLWALAKRLRVHASKEANPSPLRIPMTIERVAAAMTLIAALLTLTSEPRGTLVGAGVLVALAVFHGLLALRWVVEWPVYVAQVILLGSYLTARPFLFASDAADAVILSMLAYLDLGLAELLDRSRLRRLSRPTLRSAMVLPLVPILRAAWSRHGDGIDLFTLLATATFYVLVSVRLRVRTPAYAAAVLFNAALWVGWSMLGWRLVDHPQFYLIPVGLSTILFAEVNREGLGRDGVNVARNLGLVVVYASLVSPIWQEQSFGAWLALLILSMAGIFAGIGLRIQSFLWLGLATFVLDLAYQVGRMGMDYALARWGVMLTLGVLLFLFVALNEKKQIVATIRGYYDQARRWEG